MEFDMDGNAAVIAASTSGLGKGCATVLAREGVDVVVNGRSEDRVEAAVADVEAEAAGEVVGYAGDITDPETTEGLIETAVEEFGRLDHLVTNAGGPPSGTVMELSDQQWQDAYDLLVMSAVRLIREAVPHLRADGGGTIVTIASSSVKEADEGLVLSNAVRMAVVGLEKTLSRELAPEIRANAVLPGTHETARIEELLEAAVERDDFDSYEAARENVEWGPKNIPVGRMGQPEDMGRLVAFLSSEQSSFINGTAVTIDGGVSRSNL